MTFTNNQLDEIEYACIMAHEQNTGDLKQAHDDMVSHMETMNKGSEWEYIFPNDNTIQFGDHGFNESDIWKNLDLQEMFNEMNIFEDENHFHRQLSVEHQYRPEDIKLCGQHVLTNKDTINATMKLHYCGSNYWTGYSEGYGKVYVPMNLIHLVSPQHDMNVSMKYMGPHCKLPWRVFYIHRF